MTPALQKRSRKELRRVQAILVCILLVMGLVGRGTTTWPVINWTMYGRRTTPYPEPVRARLCVRVSSPAKEARTLLPSEIVSRERRDLFHSILERAFSAEDTGRRESSRVDLVRLVSASLPDFEFERVELVRREWAVTPLALPPADVHQPLRDETLGRFAAARYLGAEGRAP